MDSTGGGQPRPYYTNCAFLTWCSGWHMVFGNQCIQTSFLAMTPTILDLHDNPCLSLVLFQWKGDLSDRVT